MGTSAAGRLADLGGHTPAYAVTVTAALIACVLAWLLASRVTPQDPSAATRGGPAGEPTVN